MVLGSLTAMVLGSCSYVTAISMASLRFVPCNGYNRFDAPTGYCREPAYWSVLGISLVVAGLAGLIGLALKR